MRRTAAAGIAALVVATVASGTTAVTAANAVAAPHATPGPASQLSDTGALARSAITAARAHPGATGVGAGQDLAVTDALVDPDGTTHVRLSRTYHGLPVLGGDLVVHRAGDQAWEGVSGTLDDVLDLAVTPAVPAPAAERTAQRRDHAATSAATPRGALVVDATGARPRLAWRVLTAGTQADGTPSRLATYVDARSGTVIRSEQQIETVDGQGQSLYGGTVPLQLTLSGGTYSLKDPTRGGTYTTDLQGKTDSYVCQLFGMRCSTGATFTSSDAVFGSGTTSSRESAAVDAQYGTDMTWDYYQQVHGRNGIFGTGAGSYNRVHYGKNYVNAFWDGTKMTYGDGDGSNYGPLTSLDVAGHEMSHGVTEHTAGLAYSGESGGLNEATSDIFGTMVEFYAANSSDPGDYLIGEEFDLKKHAGLRRMDDPIADGASPNCWSPTLKNLDVHYSSGVGNHFFYLLAEGSGAKTIGGVGHDSPTCDGSTVTGIGHDAAARIWYRALTVYMTSDTDYAGARQATLRAATDLYGAASAQRAAVASAWTAVAVS